MSKVADVADNLNDSRKVGKLSDFGNGTKVYLRETVNTNNPLEHIKYTEKVKEQMKLGDFHSFLKAVDAFGGDGKITQIVGRDGIVRTKVEISGGYKGREGVFEYIIEPDNTVNHRFFRPHQY